MCLTLSTLKRQGDTETQREGGLLHEDETGLALLAYMCVCVCVCAHVCVRGEKDGVRAVLCCAVLCCRYAVSHCI
jgi:hypothetical protein